MLLSTGTRMEVRCTLGLPESMATVRALDHVLIMVSRFSRSTVISDRVIEYHLNYDIAFNLNQEYNVTNNKTWFDNGPRQVIESIAVMTGELLSYNETTKTWWLRNMTDPDEYANNIDNGAFTIASAAELLKEVNALRVSEGLPINETWETQWQNIAYPSAPSNITLEYQTMNNSVAVKQADVVLLTYPLDYGEDYSVEDKLLDLDYVCSLNMLKRNMLTGISMLTSNLRMDLR